MTALAALWRILGIRGAIAAGLAVALLFSHLSAAHWHAKADSNERAFYAEQAAFRGTVANYRAAVVRAQAADHAHAVAVQTRDATITKESTNALETQLAAARADAVAYARRMRSGSAANAISRGNLAGVPTPTNAASGAVGTDQTALVDDEACATAVVKAEGWLAWWTKVTAAPR